MTKCIANLTQYNFNTVAKITPSVRSCSYEKIDTATGVIDQQWASRARRSTTTACRPPTTQTTDALMYIINHGAPSDELGRLAALHYSE